ncbi:MAG: peroxisomal targeting signal 2 receptor [Thelocarpon superellum]|nr:MAG: peroxisomal targeting signal 2 receptor [Thelocarpon superellum]
MLEYRTQGFNGYGVKYSPFFDSRIAVAAFDTQDSLFDLSWSERHENQLVTACGDGSIKLFDIGINEFPIQSWQEHQREVFSVHWNLVAKDNFCSSSWDGTIKIWSPERSASIATLPTHSCTYSASWSPHSPSVLSSVSSDSHLRIFDLRTPPSAANHLQIAIPIHSSPTSIPLRSPTSKFPTFPPAEALTHDWNKYRDTILATGGVDRLIRTFDLRAPKSGPIAILAGHDYAVRKLTWSPHLSDLLLSASYDMTCRGAEWEGLVQQADQDEKSVA